MNKIFPILFVSFLCSLLFYTFPWFEHDTDSKESPTATTSLTVLTPTDAPIVQDQRYCISMIPETILEGSFSHLITELTPESTLTNGYLLRGCSLHLNDSYGKWAPLEGQIGSYAIYASDDTLLAEGPLPVSGPGSWLDYTTRGQHIPFEHTVGVDTGSYTHGYIVLKNENASGDPLQSAELTIDVVF